MKESTSYRYKGDNGKLTFSTTLQYILTSSIAIAHCGVCNSHFILHYYS